MGLTFRVGNGRHVFIEPYGSNVDDAFADHFPNEIAMLDDDEPWYSEELAWSGWKSLQQRAERALGGDAIPHLLSMAAWKGVYLPVSIDPCILTDIPGDDSPLEVACSQALVEELERLGSAEGLPIDDEGLTTLAAKYVSNDDLIDEDMDIQTYAQLLIGAHFAVANRLPLWVVK